MKLLHHLTVVSCSFALFSTSYSKDIDSPINYLQTEDGNVITLQKIIDDKTGEIKLKSSDAALKTFKDVEDMRIKAEYKKNQKYGAIKGELRNTFDNMDEESVQAVLIAPKIPGITHLDKTKHTEEEMKQHSLKNLKIKKNVNISAIIDKYKISKKIQSDNFAVVYAKKSDITKMMFDTEIASIEKYVEPKPCTDVNFSTLASSAYNPGPIPANRAAGMNCATFETGIWESFATCKGLNPSIVDISNNGSRHAQETFLCLLNAAPGAGVYHRNSLSYSSTGDQEYIFNNDIRTLSLSYSSSTEPNTFEFRIMDNSSYDYPYPLYCNPTANDGYTYEVCWQCYNSLSVGNVKHTNESTYQMNYCTQARNPDPIYSSCLYGLTPCRGDRELPHIVAPGHHPYSSGLFLDNCLSSWGACGTSYSAPIANGIATCVRAASSFASWPEAVRMAVMLTAHNVDSSYWRQGEDELDGNGVLSGNDAVQYAQNAVMVYPNMTSGQQTAYSVGSMNATDTSKNFLISIPNVKPSGKHLRIVLTWDSRPDLNAATNDICDLDLSFYNPNGNYYSTSWDDNVEVIDVPANDLTAGNTYSLRVNPVTYRLPTGGFFYYSVGWTWVKDHAN